MPNFYDFSSLNNLKEMEVNPNGWINPLIIESYAAQVLLIIIVMMPTTPGSTGITEGGAAALFSVFIDSSLIGVFILLYRFITYHMGLIAGAIFQYRIFKSVASFSLDSIKR